MKTGSERAQLSNLPVADMRSYERKNLVNSNDRDEKNKYEDFMFVRV
jgi:DNA-binding transcriptional MerR regulator